MKHTVQEILDVAKQLPASERRRLVHEIEETLAAEGDQPAHEGIDMFLALAGTGHSEHTDVSSSKGKHLAEVAWLELARKRLMDVRAGREETIPWEDIERELETDE